MSLITRCPTCETMFKVVPDQLRVSEGWVRCGQCAAVFDATQNMVPADVSDAVAAAAATPPPAQAPAPPSGPGPAPASKHAFFVRPAEPAAPTPPPASPRTPAPAPAPAAPEPLPAPLGDESSWTDAPASDPDTVFLDHQAESEPPTPSPSPSPSPEPEPAALDLPLPDFIAAQPSTKADRASDLDEPPVTFLRNAEKPSIWRRPAVRWTLAIVVLALLVLLAVQVVRMERNRIAAVEPATRPLLQAMCALTDCVLAPLRQIESVVIDSSSFSRVRGDDYRLGFALRNTAPIAIAMPSIELSLTDPQDQAVIRRVILPAEFSSGAVTLAKATVWSGSLALSVRPGTHTDRIAGYRLLAFYP